MKELCRALSWGSPACDGGDDASGGENQILCPGVRKQLIEMQVRAAEDGAGPASPHIHHPNPQPFPLSLLASDFQLVNPSPKRPGGSFESGMKKKKKRNHLICYPAQGVVVACVQFKPPPPLPDGSACLRRVSAEEFRRSSSSDDLLGACSRPRSSLSFPRFRRKLMTAFCKRLQKFY